MPAAVCVTQACAIVVVPASLQRNHWLTVAIRLSGQHLHRHSRRTPVRGRDHHLRSTTANSEREAHRLGNRPSSAPTAACHYPGYAGAPSLSSLTRPQLWALWAKQ